jgi:multiple sugar transport system substrate-binding protein
MAKKWSRRDFLKTSALFSTGVLLAACAPAVQPQQPAAATAVPQATNPPAASKKKIVFSTYVWSGFEAAMKGILDSWVAETPNVEYEGQFVPQSIDYWAKVQTQVASGTPPDCGMGGMDRVVSWAKNGTLMDITNYIMASKFPIDKMFPGASAQYRWAKGEFDSGAEGGNYYGIPSDAQSHVFAYNKKMFDDAGVAYPTDDWTWDDMLAAAQKITNADKNIWGTSHVSNYNMWMGNFLWAAGGTVHSPDFTKSMLADPRTIEAYKWSWDLIYTYKVAPTPGGVSAQQQNPFMSGQVAMFVDGVWWLADFANGIKDFDWDVAMYPKHPKTGKRTTSMESDGWWIYKDGKDPDTSWNLLSYLGSPSGHKLFSKVNYVVPSSYNEVAQDWYSTKPPEHKMKVLDNIIQDSKKADDTFFEYGPIINAVWPIIDKAFADGTDITKAMQEADTVMNEELNKAWALLKS